ncbi:MAG: hypothetical protein JKY61_13055 [Planctomycetes bacterium]|nr:hypothetical protein [Planctomycetota bacterium]
MKPNEYYLRKSPCPGASKKDLERLIHTVKIDLITSMVKAEFRQNQDMAAEMGLSIGSQWVMPKQDPDAWLRSVVEEMFGPTDDDGPGPGTES